jgi:hypothetical protein
MPKAASPAKPTPPAIHGDEEDEAEGDTITGAAPAG